MNDNNNRITEINLSFWNVFVLTFKFVIAGLSLSGLISVAIVALQIALNG